MWEAKYRVGLWSRDDVTGHGSKERQTGEKPAGFRGCSHCYQLTNNHEGCTDVNILADIDTQYKYCRYGGQLIFTNIIYVLYIFHDPFHTLIKMSTPLILPLPLSKTAHNPVLHHYH